MEKTNAKKEEVKFNQHFEVHLLRLHDVVRSPEQGSLAVGLCRSRTCRGELRFVEHGQFDFSKVQLSRRIDLNVNFNKSLLGSTATFDIVKHLRITCQPDSSELDVTP